MPVDLAMTVREIASALEKKREADKEFPAWKTLRVMHLWCRPTKGYRRGCQTTHVTGLGKAVVCHEKRETGLVLVEIAQRRVEDLVAREKAKSGGQDRGD